MMLLWLSSRDTFRTYLEKLSPKIIPRVPKLYFMMKGTPKLTLLTVNQRLWRKFDYENLSFDTSQPLKLINLSQNGKLDKTRERLKILTLLLFYLQHLSHQLQDNPSAVSHLPFPRHSMNSPSTANKSKYQMTDFTRIIQYVVGPVFSNINISKCQGRQYIAALSITAEPSAHYSTVVHQKGSCI